MLNVLSNIFKKKTDEEVKVEKGYNPFLVSQIQTQGGIEFKANFMRMGDGYVSSVHVYKYQSLVSDFWLEQLMGIENALVTLDISTANKRQIIEDINKSMAEQDTRFVNAKDNVDRINARDSYVELDDLYNQITKGEIMKRVHLRAFVKGRTLEELEIRVKDVLEELESLNFRGAVFINEQEWEWESLFTSYTNQLDYVNKRKGKDMSSTTLAGGYPFHYTFLNDEYGTYYGTTETNGSVVFDLFHRDKYRKFYNALMIGKMGTGKSTLLKKTVLDQAIKGHKIRILDVTGEFAEVVERLNGKQIALDGSEGIINVLQVFKTVTNEDGSTNETLSFTQHLSKMSVFYNFINPSSDGNEAKEFAILLRKLYVDKGMWSRNAQENRDALRIVGIPHNQVPKIPEFHAYLKMKYQKQVSARNKDTKVMDAYGFLQTVFRDMMDSNGDLFNTTTSDIIDEAAVSHRVIYDFSSLLKRGRGLMMAQFINALGFSVGNLSEGDVVILHVA